MGVEQGSIFMVMSLALLNRYLLIKHNCLMTSIIKGTYNYCALTS